MLLKIYPENPNPREIRKAVDVLRSGGVIIYPTDTIYGIGCDIFMPKAIERITEILAEPTFPRGFIRRLSILNGSSPICCSERTTS